MSAPYIFCFKHLPAKLCGIYRILNKVNHKVYIGSTVNIKKRWRTHIQKLERGNHHSRALQRAWLKYGAEQFEFSVLLITSPNYLLEYEQRALNFYQAANRNYGYNCSPTAGNQLGLKLSDESRARFVIASTGRKHTEQAKANMSAAQKGHSTSAATRAKISAAHTGKKRGPLSDETKAKISEAKRDKKKGRLSPQWRANMSMAQRDRPKTAAHLDKLHQAKIGTHISPDHAAKLRAGNAAYWQRKRAEKFSNYPE